MPLWKNVSGDWQDGNNWIGGAVPNGPGATADFVNQTNGGFMQVGIQQGTVRLSTLNVTLSGTTDMVIKGSTNDAGTAPARLRFETVNNQNIDPIGYCNINTAVGGGEFEISGLGGLEIDMSYETHFNVANAGTVARLNAPLVGYSALHKDGAGTLSIGSVNSSYTGTMYAAGGILHVLNPSGFGSGNVNIMHGGALKSSGSVGNTISVHGGGGGIQAANGATLTLTGLMSNDSNSLFKIGNATDNGTIVFSNSAFQLASGSNNSFRLEGGTVRMGNAYSATAALNFSGAGLLEISSGATLDTGGFDTRLSNLDMDGGTLRASTGALDVWITDRTTSLSAQTGTVFATAGVDEIRIDALNGFSLAGLTFSGWDSNTDQILMFGSANNNNLAGSVNAEEIQGFDGNDLLTSNGGSDHLLGGLGDDILVFNASGNNAWAQGGDGTDTLRVTGGTVGLTSVNGIEVVEMANGARVQMSAYDFLHGLETGASVSGNGTIEIDVQGGGDFSATGVTVAAGSNITLDINGSVSSANNIKGNSNAVNDITGGDSADQIRGGSLADTIYGGDGNDKMNGRAGADIMYGGAGADTFRYGNVANSGTGANADHIMDFLSGTDKLSFVNLDTNSAVDGVQGFSYIGTNAFANDGTAQLRWTDLGADLRVEADINGDGVADMHIILQGAGNQTLTANDFIL